MRFYVSFEIDEHSAEPLSEAEVLRRHGIKLGKLQRTARPYPATASVCQLPMLFDSLISSKCTSARRLSLTSLS